MGRPVDADVDESSSFYGELFGWEANQAPGDPEETSGYRLFLKEDKQVAGVMGFREEGQPPTGTPTSRCPTPTRSPRR